MAKFRRSGRRILVLAGALVILAAQAGTSSPTQKIETQKGVVIVRNPVNPVPRPGGPSRLRLVEELTIGKEEKTDGYLFAGLRSIGVDDKENIWALDWTDIKVRIFDKTGKLVNTFGKKGQGPKEMENPSRMVITSDGNAAILDMNKIALYAPDGRCLKELSTAKTHPFRLRVDRKGFFYLDGLDLGPKRSMSLVRYDPELKPVVKIAEVSEPFQLGTINAMTTLLYFNLTKADNLVWMSTSKYEMHIVDPQGKALKTIIKDYRPVKITAADRARILKDRFQGLSVKIEFPDAYYPTDFFLIDDEDRLYARTYEDDGKGGLWHDVFDAEGRCFTRFSLPKDEMAFAIKKNKLYALIVENAEGIPLIKRYAMIWE
jgi:6-bladed beta-propeller